MHTHMSQAEDCLSRNRLTSPRHWSHSHASQGNHMPTSSRGMAAGLWLSGRRFERSQGPRSLHATELHARLCGPRSSRHPHLSSCFAAPPPLPSLFRAISSPPPLPPKRRGWLSVWWCHGWKPGRSSHSGPRLARGRGVISSGRRGGGGGEA